MQAADLAPAPRPAAAPPVSPRAPWWKLEPGRRYLFGHDIFVSYGRADALDYARALADALRRNGLDAYVDQLGTPPGPSKLPALLHARLRFSSMLVLVASPAAARSWAVKEEVETFAAIRSRLFTVDVAGALDDVAWYRDHIRGGPARRITAAELASGEPSPVVIDQILKNVDFNRRETRLKRVFGGLLLGILALLVGGGSLVAMLGGKARAASALAAEQMAIANDAETRADRMTARADAALGDARKANAEAEDARDEAARADAQRDRARADASRASAAARTAMDSVEARRRTARALELANRASAAMDRTGDGLARGALLALESLDVEWTVEGMSAWMRAMTRIPPRLHLLHAHGDAVTALAAGADGRRLASGAGDGKVRVWDVRTRPDPQRRMRVSAVPVAALDFRGDVYTLAFSEDGRRLAAGSRDRRLRVWNLETGETRVLPLGRGGEFVRAAAFSPDGRWLAAAVGDSAAWLFDTKSWAGTRAGKGNAEVAAVAFGRQGRSLVVGGRALERWDVASARHASSQAVPWSYFPATALAFSRDRRTLAIASRNGVHLQRNLGDDTTFPLERFQVLDIRDANAALAFSRDGRHLAHGRRNERTARVWNVASGAEVGRMVETAGGMAFGAGWVATGHADGTVAFWPEDGAHEVMRITHPAAVLAAGFSPDGRWLATAAGDSAVRIFDARTFGRIRTIPVGGNAASVGFSPGGRWLVAARQDGFDVLESGSWRPAHPPRRTEGRPLGLAFSPDGRLVATWYGRVCTRTTEELRVWDLASGTELAGEWPGCAARGRASPPRQTGSAALRREAERWTRTRRGEEWVSADGRWHVATPDPHVVLTEMATGREVARLSHDGDVEDVAFSPDRGWLATASRDRTLRLWLFGDRERMIAEACARLPVRFREPRSARTAAGAPLPARPRNLCAERAAADSARPAR